MIKFTFSWLLLVVLFLTSCDPKDKPHGYDPPVNNDRKIGYLFYTGFINEYNSSLYQTFSKFKAQGVTDLIIDLRYNHGGKLSAASYLASLIAPKPTVESRALFTQLDFNALLNSVYDRNNWSRKYYLGDAYGQMAPVGANLNLKTVYIIATDDSYSAAELLTFCLRPYMKVVHIGSPTGGKFTASMTVTAYDDYDNSSNIMYDSTTLTSSAKDSLRNWGMQPIVAIYKDSKNSDFSVDGKLNPDVAVASRENDISAYKPLGDQTDYLLAATIARIKADNNITADYIVPSLPRNVNSLSAAHLYSQVDNLMKEAVAFQPPFLANSKITVPSINTVSQFVYDGMVSYYKWTDYMKSKTPTAADQDPMQYFESVLYPLDTQHGWSWMTNDVSALLSGFSGEPVDFGWALNFLWTDASHTKLVAFVKYVYPNTPASVAGIKRGEVISKINGADITANAPDAGFYYKLLGQDPINVTVGTSAGGRTVSLAPVKISTNPVLMDTIYTIKK